MNAADVLADVPAHLRELIIADVEARIPHDPPPTACSVEAVGRLVQQFAAIDPMKGEAA
jgi:hypothetical protein